MSRIRTVLFLALFGLQILQITPSVYSQPPELSAVLRSLVFEATEIDLGPTYIEDNITTSFKFPNSGTGELVIDKIDSSCGCVVLGEISRTFGPGKSGEIPVQFDAAEAGTTGRVKKNIIVRSNDPSNPRQVLSLRAFIYSVQDGVPYEPAALNFGNVTVATSRTLTVSMYEDSSNRFSVTKVEEPEGFEYAVETVSNSDEVKWLVKVSNRPASKIGPISALLKIHSNNTVQPVIEIPMSLNVTGEIAIEPARLFFGLVSPGGETQKIIQLSSADSPFAILETGCDLAFIQIGQEIGTASRNHTLTASIVGDAPRGRFKGTVTILTDNRYQPEIKVPVFGAIAVTDD